VGFGWSSFAKRILVLGLFLHRSLRILEFWDSEFDCSLYYCSYFAANSNIWGDLNVVDLKRHLNEKALGDDT